MTSTLEKVLLMNRLDMIHFITQIFIVFVWIEYQMRIHVCPGSEYVLEYHKQIQWQKSKNTVATNIVNYHVPAHVRLYIL